MKKLFVIWIALFLAIGLLFNEQLDFKAYITQLSDNMPNWSDFFTETKGKLDNFGNYNWFAVEVTSWETFWTAFTQFFKGIGLFFDLVVNFVIALPIKLVVNLFKTIVAFIPIGKETLTL